MLVTNIKNRCEHASKILRKRRERLLSGFLNRRDPFFLENHARIFDDYFRESFERSEVGPMMGINKNPYKTEDLIREVIYPLWDIGLDVGHATRSIKECVGLSGKDPVKDCRNIYFEQH